MADKLTAEQLARAMRTLRFPAVRTDAPVLIDALLAHIAAQDVRITELEKRLDQATEQDYCSICGGILDGYRGDERNARITALETALRIFVRNVHLFATEADDEKVYFTLEAGETVVFSDELAVSELRAAQAILNGTTPAAPESIVDPASAP